jgi:tetratricopeptide (TPR) repeat protein
MNETNYYKVLGVSENATLQEIRKAYLNLSKELHPDRLSSNTNPSLKKLAEERLKLVNEAYDTLKDKASRLAYDESLKSKAKKFNYTSSPQTSEQSVEELLSESRLLLGRAEDYLELGIALENQGDLEKAIAHYNCAIALGPDYAKAYQSRGVIFCELEDYVEAVKDLEKAADLYQKQGQEQQHQRIIKLLKKIGRAKGYYRRGIARENQGDYLGAIEDYTQTIGIEPSWALIYFNRAGVQKKIGNFKQAISDYTHAIEFSPNWANAYFQRGVTRYKQQGDDSGAIEDYNQTIRLDFYHADAYLERGIVRSAQRNHVEAIEDYSHAIRLQLSNPKAYYLRGLVYARQGEPVKAVKDLQQAAHLYQKQGNTEQSQKALQWVNRFNKPFVSE